MNGPLVKRLRHRPLTAKTWVRFPYGSPEKIAYFDRIVNLFLFLENAVIMRFSRNFVFYRLLKILIKMLIV